MSDAPSRQARGGRQIHCACLKRTRCTAETRPFPHPRSFEAIEALARRGFAVHRSGWKRWNVSWP